MNTKTLIPVALLLIVVLAGGAYLLKNKSNVNPVGAPENTSTNNSYYGSSSTTGSSQSGAAGTSASSGISLTISSPANGASVTVATVTVRGKTAPGADVSINDVEVKADSSGNFSGAVALDEGENFIAITAVDSDGNSADQELTVTYNSGL